MANHFAAIGLPVTADEELAELAEHVLENGEVISFPGGTYVHWASDCGAELWLHLLRGGEISGLEPFFQGDSRLDVMIKKSWRGAEDGDLEGRLWAWANPSSSAQGSNDDQVEGDYPFVFSAPDFRAYRRLQIPSAAVAQVTGFTHSIEVFESPAAFEESEAALSGS